MEELGRGLGDSAVDELAEDDGVDRLGVVLAETGKAAESVIGAFRQLEANILVQEFIKEAKGADLRAFVIGGKVRAAMMRQGAPGEFRSNLHRGGSAHKIKLTPEERSTAVRSAKTLGLNVAGVDMLRSNHGPVVLEVNSSPGLEGIEKATELDVAGEVIMELAMAADEPVTDSMTGSLSRHICILPMHARYRKVGVLVAERGPAGEPFDDGDVQLGSVATAQVTTFLRSVL